LKKRTTKSAARPKPATFLRDKLGHKPAGADVVLVKERHRSPRQPTNAALFWGHIMIRLSPISSVALAAALAIASPIAIAPHAAQAQAVAVSITVPPPPLPVYAQPVIPGPGYIWTPGYWAWGPEGYYWVPGTWVLPPAVGLLWTPGYWGWVDGHYFWHVGYWGPTVGFYGGINYGFGYFGTGFVGGRWDHDHFFYNRAVNNFGGVHITNVYNAPVRNVSMTHVSFNGGHGGTAARPTAAQQAAAQQHHVDPTAVQAQHEHAASQNRAFLSSVNHGRPAIGATARPASFSGAGVVHTRNASAPANAPHNNVQHHAPVHQSNAPHAQHGPGGPHGAPGGAHGAPHAAPGGHAGGGEHGGGDHGGGHDHP
jgi:hypothetical protein